jgi:tetratricopeptide (TPR) repeat protein
MEPEKIGILEGEKLAHVKNMIEQIAVGDPKQAAGIAAQLGLDQWEQYQNLVGALQLSALSLKIAGENDNVEQLAYTSGNLGNIVSAAGSLEASLIHYDNAAKYYAQLNDMEWQSMMLSSAGGVLKDLGRYEEAREKLEEAIRIAREHRRPAAEALGLLNLGSLHGDLKQFDRSSTIHRELLQLAWRHEMADHFRNGAAHLALDLRNLGADARQDAEEVTGLAIAAYKEKRYGWAIYGLKHAALLVDPERAPIHQADIYHTLSNIEFAVGEMEGAVVHLREARRLAAEVQDDAALARYCAGLSHLFLEQGKLTEAAEACDEAIASASRSEAHESLATALGNRGMAALKQDQLNLAETLLKRQYELAKEKGFANQLANAANSLGAVYEKLGDVTAAEKWFRISIDRSDNYRHPAGLHSLLNVAILQRRRGREKEALSTYQDVLARAIGAEDFDLLFTTVLNLGALHAKSGQPEKAADYLEQARNWTQEGRDARRKALVDLNEAFLEKQLNKPAEALEKFAAAHTFFKDSDWENAATCAVEAAVLLMEAGRLEDAMPYIAYAAEQYEHRMENLSDYDAWRIHRDEEYCFRVFQEWTLKVYGPEAALLASERSRGRAFRLALRRREAGHRTRAFENKRILSQAALDGILSGRTKGLKKEYVDRFVQVLSGAKDPLEVNLELSWIQDWAQKLATSIVVYARGYAGQLYAWVIDERGMQFTTLDLSPVDGIEGLEKEIKSLRRHLGIPERGAGAVRRDRQKDPGPGLQKLYSLLIEPLAGWLPEGEGARICFVPWGPLFEAPFCALMNADGQYLVDRYASFVIPTLYFFSSRRESNGEGALVIGDPVSTQDSSFGNLSPLPFAEEEARQVAEVYDTQPLIGTEALKEVVLDRLPRTAVAHFAAHGLFDEIYPLRSAVALTGTEEDNGLLYAADLRNLNLDSRLVVLSACSSALGNITGDGVLGLCREFLTAGADSLLASLWAVGDRSSAFHMTHFHRALREKPAIEALREAQLATRKDYEGVSQWGAYVLWGWPG